VPVAEASTIRDLVVSMTDTERAVVALRRGATFTRQSAILLSREYPLPVSEVREFLRGMRPESSPILMLQPHAELENCVSAVPTGLNCVVLLGVFLFAAPLLDGQVAPGPAVAEKPAPGSLKLSELERHRLKAAEEVKKEEHQRILRIVPDFYTSYIQDAEPLSRAQKFDLAIKSSFDPFSFAAAGIDAGISQAENNFAAYGQGGKGYARRFGASFVDSFDGTMFGSWLFPVLLKQDPRYFRKGTGGLRRRLFYSLATTVICKDDNRKWVFNYSNILGNLAAGGISNLYYPAADRGVILTLQRTGVVTAEGALGSVFAEFWPDISSRLFGRRQKPGVQ